MLIAFLPKKAQVTLRRNLRLLHKNFEEFLRSLKNDKRVQNVLENYDENQEQLKELGYLPCKSCLGQ